MKLALTLIDLLNEHFQDSLKKYHFKLDGGSGYGNQWIVVSNYKVIRWVLLEKNCILVPPTLNGGPYRMLASISNPDFFQILEQYLAGLDR